MKKKAKISGNNCQHKIQFIRIKKSICESTPENCRSDYLWQQVHSKAVPKLWHGDWVRFNEGGSLGLIVCLPNQCFFSRVSRAEQREQCLGSALPQWHSFKGPCWTDGHCLGWECTEGYSQSVSAPSFEFICAPSTSYTSIFPFLAISDFPPVLLLIVD